MSGCETEAYNATQKWRRLQSKSCIFCDIFISAIRDNFYFEGKHSQLLVCIFSTAWVFADMSSVFLMQTMGKSDNLLATKDIAKVFGPEPCLGLISPSNSQQPSATICQSVGK